MVPRLCRATSISKYRWNTKVAKGKFIKIFVLNKSKVFSTRVSFPCAARTASNHRLNAVS